MRELVKLLYESLVAYTLYQTMRPLLEPAETNDDPLVDNAGWVNFKFDREYAIYRYMWKHLAVQNDISQSGEIGRRIEEIRQRGTWCQRLE